MSTAVPLRLRWTIGIGIGMMVSVALLLLAWQTPSPLTTSKIETSGDRDSEIDTMAETVTEEETLSHSRQLQQVSWFTGESTVCHSPHSNGLHVFMFARSIILFAVCAFNKSNTHTHMKYCSLVFCCCSCSCPRLRLMAVFQPSLVPSESIVWMEARICLA